MKKNSYQRQSYNKKRKNESFCPAYVDEARKMWASSECLNPYENETMHDYMRSYFLEGANHE